jgi:hypothetical protein
LDEGFGGMAESIKNIVSEWKKGFATPTAEATKSFSKLKGIAEKLSDDFKGITELKGKEVKILRDQAKIEVERLKVLQAQLENNRSRTDEEQVLLDNLKAEYKVQLDILKGAEGRLQTEIKTQKTLGITGALFKGIQGTLQKIGMDASHFEGMNENLREAAKSGSAFKVLGTGIKETFKGIGSALMDPLVITGLLTAAITKVYKLFTAFNQASVDLARNFGITRKEGDQLQQQFLSISSSSESLSATLPNISEAFTDLNGVTGTFANLSSETLTTYADLTKALGVSKDTASTFYKLSLVTGKSFKNTTEEILGQTKYQKEQLHTSLSEKTIMEGIAKSTAAQRLSLRGGTEELIQSVIQAKKLGLEMNQLEGISDNLLNIESSIAAEQAAELMTNRELNLEAARYYANTNQTEKLAAVLSKDIGTAAQFQKMSRIEGETLAAAYGLSRDQLAEMLENKEMQDKLDKVGVKSEEELAQKFANRKLTLEQIQKLGGKELKDKALNLSFQEKLNNLMEKFKAAFVTELAPYFEKFADKFDNFVKGGGLKNFIEGVKTLASGIGKAIDLLTSKTVLTILGGLVGLKALSSVKNFALGQPGSSAMRPMYTKEVGFGGGGGAGDMLGGFGSSTGSNFGRGFGSYAKDIFKGGRAGTVARGRILGGAKNFLKGPMGLGIAGLAVDAITPMISEKFKGPNGEATMGSDITDVTGSTATGALTGAAIGSVIPVIGTAVGGILGGLYGLTTGLMDVNERKDNEKLAKQELQGAIKYNNEQSAKESAGALVSKYQSFGEGNAAGQAGIERSNSLLEGIYNAVSTSKPIIMNGNQVGVGVGFDNYQMQ